MTNHSEERRCRWCGRRLPEQRGPGRRRIYCKQGCRQQAHISRKLAASHGLSPGEAIVRRDDLARIQGYLFELQAALEDVDGDLARARREGKVPDYRDAFEWLYRAAEPLRSRWIEPRDR